MNKKSSSLVPFGEVRVRLLEISEKDRFDQLLEQQHYLKSARIGGRSLRYVAEMKPAIPSKALLPAASYGVSTDFCPTPPNGGRERTSLNEPLKNINSRIVLTSQQATRNSAS